MLELPVICETTLELRDGELAEMDSCLLWVSNRPLLDERPWQSVANLMSTVFITAALLSYIDNSRRVDLRWPPRLWQTVESASSTRPDRYLIFPTYLWHGWGSSRSWATLHQCESHLQRQAWCPRLAQISHEDRFHLCNAFISSVICQCFKKCLHTLDDVYDNWAMVLCRDRLADVDLAKSGHQVVRFIGQAGLIESVDLEVVVVIMRPALKTSLRNCDVLWWIITCVSALYTGKKKISHTV